LIRDDHAAGPIRLPISRQDDFIDQFNRVYGGLGLSLTPQVESDDDSVVDGGAVSGEEQGQKKIPGDLEVTGDD